MRRVGFSGSQSGMSSEQIYAVDRLLDDDILTELAHHGDCIGSDADFHRIAGLQGLKTHGHPPKNPSKRAWCKFDGIEGEKEYLDRNKDIVNFSDWMIACPPHYEEELRSGTWSTIRYARKIGRQGFIVWPDGKVTDITEDYSGKKARKINGA